MSSISEKNVQDALRQVMDPDLGRDVVSLGFVKAIEIDGDAVGVTLELTTPGCPMKQRFVDECKRVVGALPGVSEVNVTLTAREPVSSHGQGANGLSNIDAIVAVSSCKGGVGKSTVAAHLARALQRDGLRVGLLDADVFGPSFPTLFGIHKPDVYIRDEHIVPIEIHGVKTMSIGFLIGDSPAVMRGPMVSSYINQILTQTDWGELDYLLIDMPPGTGDAQLTITQTAALHGAVIVTTPQALSLVDVAKGILMFEQVNVPVLGVVENMSYFVCDQCGKEHAIFGSRSDTLQDRFGLTTLAELPVVQDISDVSGEDSGADLEPIKTLAANLRQALCARRVEQTEQPAIEADDKFIHVRWPDGKTASLSHFTVRVSCRCASCVNEHTGAAILDPNQVPSDIRPEEIRPLGNYAVAITWSDGHASGIYSWDHLRRLAGE